MIEKIKKELSKKKALIHCITNPISINQCANLILSVGCRPIMAEHPDEVSEITRASHALLLNIGNITDARLKAIPLSAAEAAHCNIPVVFDAVGIACSSFRRNFTCNFLKNFSPTVIKGNYSEIKALSDIGYTAPGVDADIALNSSEISALAAKLAGKYNSIILASGKTDIITDGKRIAYISNGSLQLGAITGTGCMLGALTACFLSAFPDMDSVVSACAYFGICGELSETEHGNGSFSTALHDKLSSLTPDIFEKYIKKEEATLENI